MSQEAIQYFKQNKDRFPKEVLVNELRKNGYQEADIAASAAVAYGSGNVSAAGNISHQPISTSFWNFKLKKTYLKPSEKWKDFLFGFFSLWVLVLVLNYENVLYGVTSLVLYGTARAETFIEAFLFTWMGGVVGDFDEIATWIVLIGYIFSLFYSFRKRRYIFYGLVAYVGFVVISFAVALFLFLL